jgi:hypothetical protein
MGRPAGRGTGESRVPRPTELGAGTEEAQVTVELVELVGVVEPAVLEPGPDKEGLPEDMFGQFFCDGSLVVALEELVGASVDWSTGADAELVVTTCLVEAGAERAKAAAVPPPTIAPDSPTTVATCLSFGRMKITSPLSLHKAEGAGSVSALHLLCVPRSFGDTCSIRDEVWCTLGAR